MTKEQRFYLSDVIEQELDKALVPFDESQEPVVLDEERRSMIINVIDKYLSEELDQQIQNALF